MGRNLVNRHVRLWHRANTTLDFYINRPHPDDEPHGWGPVLLAGTELVLDKK